MPTKCFQDDHGRTIRVKIALGNGGTHVTAALIVRDGEGFKAIPLKDVYEPGLVKDGSITDLEPLARTAKLCPAHPLWGAIATPGIEEIGGTVKEFSDHLALQPATGAVKAWFDRSFTIARRLHRLLTDALVANRATE